METKFSDLQGKIIKKIILNDSKDRITFVCSDGEIYIMYHSQDCCESVQIEDIIGDFDDIIGKKIIKASEETSNKHPIGFEKEWEPESFTWTFYHIETRKSHVTIRWYGESNGFYSESVYFEKTI